MKHKDLVTEIVKYWQAGHGLKVTGEINEETRNSIDPDELQKQLIRFASSDIGRKEVGRNSGAYVKALRAFCDFPANATGPWCAVFASYHIKQAYKISRNSLPPFELSRGARALLRNIVRSDAGRRIATPEPGAIAVWRRGGGWTGHVRIVQSYDASSDTMTCIAGNERNKVRLVILRDGSWRKGLVGMGALS